MKGNNEIMLNQASMTEIVQYYFDSIFVPSKAPTVTAVSSASEDGCFNIEVTDPKQEQFQP